MKKLNEIFDIWYGVNLELMRCEEQIEGIPFVSRTSANNGIVGYVKELDELEPNPAHTISVACSGSVLSTFYQPNEYYSGRDVYILKPKNNLSVVEMLYYCTAIEKNKYRYNYGRAANKTLKDIRVPSIDEIQTKIDSLDVDYYFPKTPLLEKEISLDTSKWGWFKMDDIFKIYTSNDKNIESSDDGITPYISASQLNNGISNYVSNEASQKENTLTVARNGSIGATFYHPYNYCVSPDDVRIFEPKFSFNKYIAIFISVLIEKEKYRYAYGRKFGTKRMTQTKLKLPINTSGKPDWLFMEDYIKSLPYSSSL
ncbi:MAG: restriction endonuclease subunit S [Bacteroidota bacterium]|nr:restriction endonuclease subunit S [Bacteroidota bacterium]